MGGRRAILGLAVLTVAVVTFLMAAQAAADVESRRAGNVVLLSNERTTLRLDLTRGGAITSLLDRDTGQEFIAEQKEPRLFQAVFSEKGNMSDKRLWAISNQAQSVTCDVRRDGERVVATLSFQGFAGRDIEATCTGTLATGDPLVRWRLSLTFPDDLVLEAVQLPFLVLRAPLGAGPEDDAAVMGQTKGGVYRRPAEWKTGATAQARQPGSLAAQFACYYDNAAGFYLASQDTRGYVKTCQWRRTDEGMLLHWEQNCYQSSPFELDYDVVLTTFRSGEKDRPTDWRDGADLYKTWAVKQPWCKRTYAQRSDIPAWLKTGPAMVRFGRNWLANPDGIREWLREYWLKRFPSNTPLIVAYWGWEKVESWVTPDYFPVFPSDEAFTALAKETRRLGCHTFLWPSGYHYTLTYGAKGDGTFQWDDRERFDRVAKPHAVQQRDGSPYRGARSWLQGGETSALCPGDPWTIDWLNDIAVQLCKRGADMIQVDQVVGGALYWCYSTRHKHPPGPGPWMTNAFRTQLQTMLRACRAVDRDAVVCFEEPNELFIQEVAIQDYRDFEILRRGSPSAELASVFNYVYHEYLPTFQSNPAPGDTFMAAYCLVNGQIPHMVPSRRFGSGPLLDNGEFEQWSGNVPAGWDKVGGWQGTTYTGKCGRDENEKHGGTASLWLENTGQDEIVQVSQNIAVGPGLRAGGTYRMTAWMKTTGLAAHNGIILGTFAPGLKSTGSWRLDMPQEATEGWVQREATFTVPEGSQFLRIMLHLQGPGKVWIDDLKLEEILADGSARPVMRPETPADYTLMRQWVELFHGEGRPYLMLGTMLHPPELETADMTYQGRIYPAVLHNAYRAADGSEAVIAVNVTDMPQEAKLFWGPDVRVLRLKPWEARLVGRRGGMR